MGHFYEHRAIVESLNGCAREFRGRLYSTGLFVTSTAMETAWKTCHDTSAPSKTTSVNTATSITTLVWKYQGHIFERLHSFSSVLLAEVRISAAFKESEAKELVSGKVNFILQVRELTGFS